MPSPKRKSGSNGNRVIQAVCFKYLTMYTQNSKAFVAETRRTKLCIPYNVTCNPLHRNPCTLDHVHESTS